MLVRGTTYNGFIGSGGPYGSDACTNRNPNTLPLGGDPCFTDGVNQYPIVCDSNDGFTYNGVYFACPPI